VQPHGVNHNYIIGNHMVSSSEDALRISKQRWTGIPHV